MSPTLTRTELNNAEDIIREVGVHPTHRGAKTRPSAFGSPLAGCAGKVPYKSKPAAEHGAARGCMAYRCRYCRNWHVGNVSKNR